MACFDLEMQLCAAKSIATAITSDAYDFGQPAPNSGAWADPIYLVIHPTVAGTGTEAATNGVTFSIDDSDDGSDFTSILTLPAGAGAGGPKWRSFTSIHTIGSLLAVSSYKCRNFLHDFLFPTYLFHLN